MGLRTFTAGRVAASLAALLAAIAGCDGGSIIPPPAPELNAVSDSGGQAPAALSLALISSPQPTDEGREWANTARTEAGRARVSYSESQPEPDDPPSTQAGMIRAAAGRGVSALVVDPVDDPAVVAALNDARDKGASVVLVGRGVTDRDPAKPLARVTFVPLGGPVRTLTDALTGDLRKAGLPADGHALIVVKAGAGPQATGAAVAFTSALKSAGFTGVEVVPVADDPQKASDTLEARAAADPKVTALLGIGDRQVRAVMSARDELKKKAKRALSVGGCVTLSRPIEKAGYSGCFGVLDLNQPALARKAVGLALSLARGEPAPAVGEVPITFHEGIPAAPELTPPLAKPGEARK